MIGPGNGFQPACGDAPSDAFGRVRFRALRAPGLAMKLVGPLDDRSPGLRFALAFEIERHGSADEVPQGRLIDLVAFVDVDGTPGIPAEGGVE